MKTSLIWVMEGLLMEFHSPPNRDTDVCFYRNSKAFEQLDCTSRRAHYDSILGCKDVSRFHVLDIFACRFHRVWTRSDKGVGNTMLYQ